MGVMPFAVLPAPVDALPPGQVAVAVVIPAYRQPGLLAEALASVLGQRGNPPAAAIVVDDGCPTGQTHALAGHYAAAHPGRVLCVRRRNGGLSAARNTGVEVALAAFPACRAIYLLDADNRLHPPFLRRAMAALDAAPPRVGWIYPDIDMFGQPASFANRGDYALLAHLSDNYCEAGSLVRRSLFETGLRYDEAMRSGFEDWDFWLQAAAAGWRGRHLPESGFQYRRRPESMLREAERMRDGLLQHLRGKHAALLRPRRLLALEAEEAPRFALYLPDKGLVRLQLDPNDDDGPALLPQAARQRWLAAQESPGAAFFPPLCCFADQSALALLCGLGLAHGLFWHAERLLRDHMIVPVEIAVADQAEIALEVASAAGRVATAPLVFATTEGLTACARDTSTSWLDTVATETPQPRMALLRVTLPAAVVPRPPTSAAPLRQLLLEVTAMGRALRSRSRVPPGWRQDARHPRAAMARRAAAQVGLGATLPRRPRHGAREVGFVLPLLSFGGVERVVLNQAAVFRAAGWRTHLVVAGAQRVELLPGLAEAFDSITMFAGLGEDRLDWEGDGYFGAAVSQFAAAPEAPDVLGLLAACHVVINTQTPACHALMAQLRRGGTRTFAGLHVTDLGAWGEPTGTPLMVNAYEHAYDGMLVISEQMRSWCLGQGIAADKLHLVRNAPGTPLPARQRTALLAARERRQAAGGPLNLLFLGRLDAQKGLDRLAAIIARTQRPGVAWRVVGRSVIGGHAQPWLPVAPEPPVTAPEDLAGLYAWADVVVLPSRFEGVPLTVLEAQRLGCAVIATDVGAVREAVADGEDGWLVDHTLAEEAIIARFVALLAGTAVPRQALLAVGPRAAARVAAADWSANLAPFLAHLEAVLATDDTP